MITYIPLICTPNPRHLGKGYFSLKYTWEYKLECVLKYKKGQPIDTPSGVSRTSFMTHVRDWVRRYDDLGIDGLKHSVTLKAWTAEEKFALVAKVLAGNSIRFVALEAHINPGQLYQWVKRYREKGYDGLQCKPGRKPKIPEMKEMKQRDKTNTSLEEDYKVLQEKNLRLEMENVYLKKLSALVSQRKKKDTKAKKQK